MQTVVALKLRSVTLEDIFTAIGITPQTTQTGNGAIDPNTGPFLPGQFPPGAVQAITVSGRMVSFTLRQAPAAEIAKPVCRAFSRARHLAGKSEAAAGKALEEGEEVLGMCWKLLQDSDRSSTKIATPRLSLHRATKLLVVAGQPEQIEVVEPVINQLDGARARAGGPFIDPNTGLPAAFGAGAPGAAHTEALRVFAARYGLGPGLTPWPSSASTNLPAESQSSSWTP